MSENIEELVRQISEITGCHNPVSTSLIRNALTEQAEAFKGELRAYDGMVRELTKTVEDMQAAQSVPVAGALVAQNPSRMCVVFDGPPSGEAPRFIEVEDGNGNSINAGEWLKRDDGLWELRLIAHLPLNASTTNSITAAELERLQKNDARWLKANEGGKFCIARYSAEQKKWVDMIPEFAEGHIDAAIAQGKGE